MEESDGEAGDLVAELELQVVNTELAKPVRAIGECVDDFEFEEALERLNALRDTMRSRTAAD